MCVSQQRQCKEKVIVIGIANRRDAVDRRLFKLGRFVFSVETGIPTEEDRYKVLYFITITIVHDILFYYFIANMCYSNVLCLFSMYI